MSASQVDLTGLPFASQVDEIYDRSFRLGEIGKIVDYVHSLEQLIESFEDGTRRLK